jgi:hypothetical protein
MFLSEYSLCIYGESVIVYRYVQQCATFFLEYYRLQHCKTGTMCYRSGLGGLTLVPGPGQVVAIDFATQVNIQARHKAKHSFSGLCM